MLHSYKASLGDIDFETTSELSPVFGIVFTVLASFLLTTLILNLLIAVMSEAYENVKETAEAHWCYIQFGQLLEHERISKKDPTIFPRISYPHMATFRGSNNALA